MKFNKSNPDNVWRVTDRNGKHFYVKCPSRSGAKTFLAGLVGVDGHAPFTSEIWAGPAPEGEEILQASFLAPHDPRNWEKGRI